MSGDFIAYLIHQNSEYVDIDDNIYDISYPKNANNRYLFPCLTTDVLDWSIKLSGNRLLDEDIDKLTSYYNNESLVLPTHRFRTIFNDKLTYIRLYTHDIYYSRLSYAMWFLKSHCMLQSPQPERIDVIKKIENQSRREELMTKFTKWKWLAYRYECYCPEKGFDTRYYVKNYFIRYYYIHGHLDSNYRQGYNYIDANELIYKQKIEKLCNLLDINLNKSLLQSYTDTNYAMLEKYSIDIYSDKFFDQLHDLVEPELNKTMNLYKQKGILNVPQW